jgi:hypothetical protein
MKLKRFVMSFLAACAFTGLTVAPATAAITFELDTEFSGGTPPAGPSPWVTATFEDLAGGGVQLTISASGLVGTEFISEFYFNLDPTKNAASFAPTSIGTSAGTQTDWNIFGSGSNSFKADGDGFFDFVLDLPPPPGTTADKFTAGETFVITWAASLGLTAADFNYASVNGPVGKTGFYAAAHVQSIGTDDLSGWIGDGGNGGTAPEPGTLALLGLGLAGLGIAARRKQ